MSGCAPRPASLQRLTRRVDFVSAAGGSKAPAASLVLQARDRRDSGPPRVGFTVTRKAGTAVERNRIRRRLREVVRLTAAGLLRPGNDYVLIGRRAALDLPFDRLTKDLLGALSRVHRGRRPGHGGKAPGPMQRNEAPADGENVR